MRVRSDGPQLISQMITKYLNIDCSVLMGANIAGDIGREQLSEAVIGYTNLDHAKVLKKLFETNYFVVNLLPDVVGAEMCGTLKNIVALAAGMVDGLGLGPNSKATIMRQVCATICICLVLVQCSQRFHLAATTVGGCANNAFHTV